MKMYSLFPLNGKKKSKDTAKFPSKNEEINEGRFIRQ